MKDNIKILKDILGDQAREREILAPYTTFKIGGPADLFYEARSVSELVDAVKTARKLGVAVFVLGGGSNILIGDRGIRGLVIRNATGGIAIRGMKGELHAGKQFRVAYVQAEAGVPINKLVRFTIEEGLGGLHMHLGLPGSVGGAVYMNSKWTHPDGYVGDVVYQATILAPSGDVRIVPKAYFHFAYDASVIQRSGDVVLSVTFVLVQENKDELWRVANESIAYRRQTQPQGVSSAGCTFRNISATQAMTLSSPNQTTSAGFLVDHAGCKGMEAGDAQISPLHANFIINRGKASAADVVKLIETARERVKAQFNITLAEEIIRVGEF